MTPAPCALCSTPTDRPGPTGLCRPCAAASEALCRAHAALLWELAPATTFTPLDTTSADNRADAQPLTPEAA